MALPKKGWRKINVGDVSYCWTIKFESPRLYLLIMSSDGSGQRLKVWFDEDRVVTPRVVEYTIVSALTTGWQPAKAKPDIVIDGDNLVSGTDFKLDHPPNCYFPY